MNQPNTYLDNELKDKLKALRNYESQTYAKWGNRKRIFNSHYIIALFTSSKLCCTAKLRIRLTSSSILSSCL